MGRVHVILEAREGANWVDTEIRPAITSRWVITYPGLERRSQGAPVAQHYRVRVDAPYYRALYADPLSPGVEVAVIPYNDDMPPPVPLHPQDLLLLPGATYPFPSHLRVLRGLVRLVGTGEPVVNAMVREGTRERVLTDERGVFALPLRWPAIATPSLSIDIENPHTTNITTHNVTLPDDLAQGVTFEVS
jgi:hypothetical protein